MIGSIRKVRLPNWILTAIAGSVLAWPPIAAQDVGIDGDAYVAGQTMPGVCMVRMPSTADSATAAGPTHEIVAAVSDVESLQSKGYAIAPCPDTLDSHALVQQWRDRVCEVASIVDEHRQQQFETEWGERAALLCGSVERVVGSWAGPADFSGVELE